MADEARATRRRAGKQMATGTNQTATKPEAKAAPKRALEDLSIEELRSVVKVFAQERNEARALSAKLVKVIEDVAAVARDAEYRMRRAVEEHNQALQPKAPSK